VDFRTNQAEHSLILLNGAAEETVNNFKFLGVPISEAEVV
jgi:hypothetical protein